MTSRASNATPLRTVAPLALIFLAALIPLLSTPVLPFLDFYSHLARFFILTHIQDSVFLRENYQSHWALLPNLGFDILGTTLLPFVPQQLQAHVVITIIFLIQFGGIIYFNRTITGHTSFFIGLLAIPTLYSYVLNEGWINFILGLGMAFWAAGWWWSHRDRPRMAVPVGCVLAIVLYFIHGLGLVTYGLIVLGLEFGAFIRTSPRDLRNLVKRLALVAVQAIVPFAIFMLSPTSHTHAGLVDTAAGSINLARHRDLAAYISWLLRLRLSSIVRVEQGPWSWLDVLTLTAQVGLVGWLALKRRLRIAPVALPLIVLVSLLVLVAPNSFFSETFVFERPPFLLLMIVVGSLEIDQTGGPGRASVIVLASIVAVRLIATVIGWAGYAQDLAEFRSIAPLIPEGSLINGVSVDGSRIHDETPVCAMYHSMLISQYGQIADTFHDEHQQPLRLIGRLQAAVSRMPVVQSQYWGTNVLPLYQAQIADSGPDGFDYVLLCNADRYTLPLPADTQLIARTRRFALLKTLR